MLRFESSRAAARKTSWGVRKPMRLFSLILGLGMVIVLMQRLREPGAVRALDALFGQGEGGRGQETGGRNQEERAVDRAKLARGRDISYIPEQKAGGPVRQPASFQEVLELAGWDAERLSKLATEGEFTGEQELEVLRLMQRLEAMPRDEYLRFTEWISEYPTSKEFRIRPLGGKVQSIATTSVPSAVENGLTLQEWTTCEVEISPREEIQLLTPHVPASWSRMEPASESIFCSAVRLTEKLYVTPRISWFPTQVRLPEVNGGMVELGRLRIDVAAWDELVRFSRAELNEDQKLSLGIIERDAFFEALSKFKAKLNPESLWQTAQGNLERYVAPSRTEPTRVESEQRELAASEVLESYAEGRFSVVPLFVDARNQQCELVALEGLVRRAVRVDASRREDGSASDVPTRFGIDHYYEVDLFTADSQDLPIVFCVPELPPAFPEGDNLHEPARMAGFLFKTWAYRKRDIGQNSSMQTAHSAPLLLGAGVIPITREAAQASGNWKLGFAAVTALVGLGAAGWWAERRNARESAEMIERVRRLSTPVLPHEPRE